MKRSEVENCRCVMEEETQRVKSIAFHPGKPVVLVALHNGKIQGWNYTYKTILFELAEHEGPVRVVIFHRLIELFASAGDDCLIRLWNYKTRKVESVLKGHTDYVRSLEFHSEHPWILSASDDQTVRIWNFQSKKQLACLTGHTHYVMCARFISSSLFASVSLDQTIRIWDYSALTTKSQASVLDMLGIPEVLLKHIVDGHDRGINWIAAKPGAAVFATGGDDNAVRIWDASSPSIYEMDTLHGHHSYVSSLYYAHGDVLVSNSEDGTMKFWDAKKRQALLTLTATSRFWCLAADPSEKHVAAGTDTGFRIYSLEPADLVISTPPSAESVVFQRGRSIFRLASGREQKVCEALRGLRRIDTDDEGNILLAYKGMFGVVSAHSEKAFKGSGSATLHNGRVYVSDGESLSVLDASGSLLRRTRLKADRVFALPQALLLLRGSMLVLLPGEDVCPAGEGTQEVDMQEGEEKSTGESENRREEDSGDLEPARSFVLLPEPPVQVYPFASSYVAQTEHFLVVLDASLNQVSIVEEILSIKSVLVHGSTVFYSTPAHIKFAFAEGGSDSSVLISTEEAYWVLGLGPESVEVMTRSGIPRTLEVDKIEWEFKHALASGDTEKVGECIASGALLGEAPLAYMIRHGAHESALDYVTDPEVRVELCLQAGKYEQALESALRLCEDIATSSLEEPEPPAPARVRPVLERVGLAAACSNPGVAEKCFVRARSYAYLVMLYVATNRTAGIKAVLEKSKDRTMQVLAAILTGDTEKLSAMVGVPSPHTTKCSSRELNSHESSDAQHAHDKSSDAQHDTEKGEESALGQFDESSTRAPVNLEDSCSFSSRIEEAKSFFGRKDMEEARRKFVKILRAARDDRALPEEKRKSCINTCSAYIQCILASEKRKSDVSDTVAVSCAVFLAALHLIGAEHREKILRSSMLVLYKRGNKLAARNLALELARDFSSTDPKVLALAEKSSRSLKNAVQVDASRRFCVDTGEYLEEAKECSVCHAYTSSGNMSPECPCCLLPLFPTVPQQQW